MSATFKIRLLLFLLTISFAATALTIHFTFDKSEILEFDGSTIEHNLNKKEKFIKSYLADNKNLINVKTAHQDPNVAITLINELEKERSIYVHTYYDHNLIFWGTNKVAPITDAGLKEGSSFYRPSNGWYEAVKKTYGRFSVVFLIPIKSEYKIQNKHLRNTFSSDLIGEDNLDIANFDDKQVYNVKTAEGKYLFAVRLKSAITNTFYSKLELWMWLLTAFFATVFANYVAILMSNKGYVKWSIALLFLYFLIVRILTLEFAWFDTYFDVPVFDAKYYHGSYFFPTLGDFLLNAIMVSWFICFVFSYRFEISLFGNNFGKPPALAIFSLLGIIIYLVAYQHNEIFHSLVTRSNINFDLNNVIYLSPHSWLGILLMCVAIFNVYLLIEIVLAIGENLPLTNRERLIIFLAGIAFILTAQLIFNSVSIHILFFGIIIFLRGWAFYNKNHGYKLVIFLFTTLLFAIIASIKLASFQYTKERAQRQEIAQRLESADDPNAVLLFFSIEQNLLKEELLTEYFGEQQEDKEGFKNKLRKLYFDGYLSRYDFDIHPYWQGVPQQDEKAVNYYRKLVVSGAIKVSEYFYRVNNTFGVQNYFALIPVTRDNQSLGTLAFELKSKTFKEQGSFPEVLADAKINTEDELNNYSFAFYSNGRLLNQNGDYIYNLVNNDFKGQIGKFVYIEKNGYSHIIYQSTARKLVVVSKPVITWVIQLASVSFLFLVLLSFSTVLILIHQIWVIFHDDKFRLNGYRWSYLISRNRILYKTRIQASLVAAIVVTLMIVGGITYFSISQQFKKQQEQDLMTNINRIKTALENNQTFTNGFSGSNDQILHTFAEINATDLNLYDTKGRVIFTTQPNIYDYGFIERLMNAESFIYLNKYQRSELLNYDQIGKMRFITAYKPIRNNENETIAYLSLPYYSNEQDYDMRVGSYLNTLINVYALVLVVIALFAIFLANEITYPLTLVGKSLGQIQIGSRNEPIQWKSNDEIGGLIKEYNNMIMALEDSAQKLARSERESAWREMAKQVAHEIKNPLTPLKLGVQLLEKSWREKDPNFDKKFEKFSKSFIEQIESLSLIASEFSNFAKMPDTPFENLEICEIIDKSIDVYRNSEDLNISFIKLTAGDIIVKGGKDHLLRIFNNLIKNAIEAIPDFRKGNIEIILNTDSRNVNIEVKDNGKGIPEDLRERIFNPNFTTKSSGTGLGLAFVKQAIENMFGTIRFETEQNKGTTFYITLPLAS
ncbi:sensor histidine kinase [Desertivirga arenae]|uniref:sensor histidine kinase n=1 Tax=Desertivirga arenae TaxID=2810309 RepID=UPI001A96BA6A